MYIVLPWNVDTSGFLPIFMKVWKYKKNTLQQIISVEETN